MEALKAKLNKFEFESSKALDKKDEDKAAAATVSAAHKPQAVEETAAPKSTKRTVNKAELKQKIEQFNKKLLAVQSDLETPAVDSTKPVAKKSEPKAPLIEAELPAYLKHKDLASGDLDPATKLTLPKTYSSLLDAFKGSDTIIKMLFNRDEICTFLKLRMGIQNITKHNFTQQHLAQIKTVYPEAYVYKQEKMFVDFKNDYHLIVTPNLNGKSILGRNVCFLSLNRKEIVR